METFWFFFDKSGTVVGWLSFIIAVYPLLKRKKKDD